jgi:hypothetical protein
MYLANPLRATGSESDRDPCETAVHSRAGATIEAVATLARHKSLNVAQKYARRADQLKREPSKNSALSN